MDDRTQVEIEAAAFRRLVEHLRERTDVQNIDLMNLAGFCRNCLSNWMKDAADEKGVAMTKDESREAVYGMSYEEWKRRYQQEAGGEQKAALKKTHRASAGQRVQNDSGLEGRRDATAGKNSQQISFAIHDHDTSVSA